MKRLPITVAWLLALPAGASAHHSGLYDEANVVALEGAVVAIHWINPHVRITLETVGDDGEVERWDVEGTSVNALERWGIEPDLLAVGDRLRVRGPASRFGRNAMIGATVDLPSGERVVLWPNVAARLGLAETGVEGLFPPPSQSPAAAAAPSAAGPGTAVPGAAPAVPGASPAERLSEGAASRGIFKVWTPRGRPPAVDPESLPLTAPARAAARGYDPLTDDPALRCEPPGMPVMLDTPYPVELVDAGERIVMRYEEWDGVRTVHMQPGNGPPVEEPSPRGVSFGRFEGETLAIFTLYIDYPYFDDLGTPQSAGVTVLERYTPNADASRLDWQVTVTDPATFTEPIVRRGYLAYEPGEVIKPYDCTLL